MFKFTPQEDSFSVKCELGKQKRRLYFLTWGAALVVFIVMMFPRYGINSFCYLILIPLFPVGFPVNFNAYLSDNSAMVLAWITYIFYVLHAIIYALSRNKILVRCLLVLLAVVLFVNIRGCRIIADGLDSIH
jgi:hypothetical protein